MKKVSKISVGYSKGMEKSHCGICKHYLTNHACTRVEGRIDPDMWCRLFAKAEDKK